MNKAELILNKIAWGSIVWGSPTELEICERRIMIEAKEKRGAFVNQKEQAKPLRVKAAILGIAMLVLVVPNITLASIDVYFSLVDDPEQAIIQELDKAEKSIDIAMYYFTDRDLANAVIDGHNRGVRVRIYLNKDQREAKYSKSCYLAKYGISIRYSSNPYYMHHKFAVIDEEVVATGRQV